MRNPFARALVLAISIIVLGAMMLRSDSVDVRAALIKTANSAKQTISTQKPLISLPKEEPHVSPVPSPVKPAPEASTTPSSVGFANSSYPMSCNYDMDNIKSLQVKYGLGEKLEYTKRYVKTSRQDIERKSMTKLKQKLIPDNVKVINVTKKYQAEVCPAPLEAPVTRSPFPSTANASDFIFGVSTTYKRFVNPVTSSINEWTYWLTDGEGHSNGGKLVLMLLDASDEELEDAYERLTRVGIDVDVYQSDPSMEMAVRYLTLVPTLYTHPERPGKKWIVTCDDDTFFPSFNSLAERLAQYDHTKPMYIGTLSEDINNVDRHGSQAFGGAGVFLSESVAKLVTEKYDECKADHKIREADSGWGPQGDILLRKCIYENSDTKLSLLNELWQLDLFGDPSGFYESGIKPLSLHHYRGGGWHIAFPWQYTKVAHVCGEDCTMQRFQTADNFVISNGFSVAFYPQGADKYNFNQFERTFSAAPADKGWNLDYMFGPQRPSLHKTGQKISWDLQEATVNKDGSVTQIYVRKANDWRWKTADGSLMSNLDGILELIWIP